MFYTCKNTIAKVNKNENVCIYQEYQSKILEELRN